MRDSQKTRETIRETHRLHRGVKWLLTLLSGVVTVGLIALLNGQLR